MKTKATRQKTDLGIEVQKTVTVDKPAEELYRSWRELRGLSRFMDAVLSVDPLDEKRSHWKVRGPAGKVVEWNAVIVEDVPDTSISWRTEGDPDVRNQGLVTFTSYGRGTEVRVSFTYRPPAGALGAGFASLFGREPAQQLGRDLRRFKALMETGEVPTNALTAEAQEPALSTEVAS